MSQYIQSNYVVALPNAATYTVLASDSGKLLLIPGQGAAMAISLPAPQIGLSYKFMVTGATVGQIVTITPSGGATVTGSGLTLVPGANGSGTIANISVAKNGAANIQILAAAARGDTLSLTCDGAIWYANGLSGAATSGFA
jgi:hypothetical protein